MQVGGSELGVDRVLVEGNVILSSLRRVEHHVLVPEQLEVSQKINRSVQHGGHREDPDMSWP